MIISNPVKRIAEIVSEDPVRLVHVLDSLLPRKKGKKVTNLSTLSKPEIVSILKRLEAERLAG